MKRLKRNHDSSQLSTLGNREIVESVIKVGGILRKNIFDGGIGVVNMKRSI